MFDSDHADAPALLREVTYESVLKRLRRVYHRQVARWLEQAAGTRVSEYAALIADHDKCSKAETPAAFHHLGHTIDVDQLVGEFAVALFPLAAIAWTSWAELAIESSAWEPAA